MDVGSRVFYESQPAQNISGEEAYEIVKEAYVYAYPLMLQYATMRQGTNFTEPTGIAGQGPFNWFSHALAFPPVDFNFVVRANLDTLYSVAYLDLDPEPLVLSVPATDRYFMLPIMSLWTDVFVAPGTRTTGRNAAREFLLVGPRWHGEGAPGEIIRSPTRFAVIGGRTQTNGIADYENVHRVQQGYKLTLFSNWVKGVSPAPTGKVDPAIDMKTAPPVQVENMDAAAFFDRFARLLKDNPPGPCDYPILHRLERVGFRPGESFLLKSAARHIQDAFAHGLADGRLRVAALGRQAAGEGSRGWVYSTSVGAYGVNYSQRAAVAYYALGMNLPQDAIYPSISADSQGRPLEGKDQYVLHFDKGELPPVEAFWSVTAYNADGYFIPNALKRQAIGDRDQLRFNPDGSLDLYIQSDPPGRDREANWLPVARAPFTLLMRLYSPRSQVLDGTWRPPEIRRVTLELLEKVA
jgi:hypothetical protein